MGLEILDRQRGGVRGALTRLIILPFTERDLAATASTVARMTVSFTSPW